MLFLSQLFPSFEEDSDNTHFCSYRVYGRMRIAFPSCWFLKFERLLLELSDMPRNTSKGVPRRQGRVSRSICVGQTLVTGEFGQC